MLRNSMEPIVPRLLRVGARRLRRMVRNHLALAKSRAHVSVRGSIRAMEDSAFAQRERIVEALNRAEMVRQAMRSGLIILPDAQEAAFQAMADAGVFNRRHPDLAIATTPDLAPPWP